MSEYDVLINKYDALNAGYDQLYPKPMKHANTHASDGTDPITPGDIGAYSKNEADTLLANKAPAGFGLGLDGSAKALSANDDINDMLFGGGWYFYHADNLPQNAPNLAYTHIMRIDALQGNVFVQTIYGITDGYGYQTSPVVVRRFRYGSMIRPWEYVNPPMDIGVEYRTTERFNGKPVYVKMIDFGAMPNSTQKGVAHGISNMDAIVGNAIFVTKDGLTWSAEYTYEDISHAWCDRTHFYIRTKRDMTSFSATVTIKCTKTTD